MKQIILQIQNDGVAVETVSNSIAILRSAWFWISLFELLVIIFLTKRLYKIKTSLSFSELSKDQLKNAQSKNIDMDNLMDSINGSRDLYKSLSRKCHPDKFINTEKQKLAEEIFQEVSNNKRNHKKLSELKERAINELNINI